MNILVIDDDNDVRNAVVTTLKLSKHGATGFSRPDEAVEFLSVAGMHQDFDLVLTDFNMPVMNGLAVARAVRSLYKLPVIIMSGDDILQKLTTEEQKEIALLKKPFSNQELAAALVKVKRAAKRG